MNNQSRAPRFAVQPDETQSLHFVREGQAESVKAKKVVDMSATGVAFYVQKAQAPKTGEKIQLDVGVLGIQPRRIQSAEVIRVESSGEPADLVKVAVRMINELPIAAPAQAENYLGWIVAALFVIALVIVLAT